MSDGANAWRRFTDALSAMNLYLGHGRALESALVFVKLQFFVMMAFSPWPPFVMAFRDLPLSHWVLSLPFLAAGGTSLVGLVLNAWGYERSRFYRIAGASMGMSIWIYILVKNVLIGWPASGINPWCMMGIVGSIWIIRRGALGLPPPGAVSGK